MPATTQVTRTRRPARANCAGLGGRAAWGAEPAAATVRGAAAGGAPVTVMVTVAELLLSLESVTVTLAVYVPATVYV